MLFNEILEGGLNQVVVKRFGMQTGTAVPAVQPELAVDLTFESDRPEWGFLKGEYRHTAGISASTPAAGSHAGMFLDNPANSGMIVTIESVYSSAASRITVGAWPATLVDSGQGWATDTRQPARSKASWVEVVTVTASLPTRMGNIPANAIWQQPIVLAPGGSFGLYAQAAATSIWASMTWRERPVSNSELG